MQQDVGNIIWLDHIHLEVPDLDIAHLFYGTGLGLPTDDSTSDKQRSVADVVWYNIGRQQLHIKKGLQAQRLPPGCIIGLVLPDVVAVVKRLREVSQQMTMARKQLGLKDLSQEAGRPQWQVTDTHGVQFMLHQPGALPDTPFSAGIAYLQLPSHEGTLQSISSFYQSYLGALVRVDYSSRQRSCQVVLGPGMHLNFMEEPALGHFSEAAAIGMWEGCHLVLYVANFSDSYSKVADAGHIDNEHPYQDKCYSLKDALQHCQFRFRDIPLLYDERPEVDQSLDPDHTSAITFWQLESKLHTCCRIGHEIRSLHHPCFMTRGSIKPM